MKFNELRLKIKKIGVFSLEDIFKWFPESNRQTVKNQLKTWIQKGDLLRLKKSLYFLKEIEVDEFFLANRLYQPSYVSLESALNYYGIVPDIPFAVTSVTIKRTQEFKNEFGLFLYRTIKSDLFFGWQEVKIENGQFYKIAGPEKALFDFLYLNQNSFGKNFPEEERFSFTKDFVWQKFRKYGSLAATAKFGRLIDKLIVHYD